MLIHIFRTSYLPQYLLLILISGVLWLPSFLSPPEPQTFEYSAQPLYNITLATFSKLPLIPVILGYILLLAGGFTINVVMISNNLVSKNSLVPSLVYSVFMSIHTETLTLTPALLSSILIILAINELYKIYELTDALKPLLTISLLISAASLFNFSCIFLFPFIFICLIIVRIGTWRDWLVPVIGFLLPYLYLWVYYFIADRLPFAYDPYAAYFSDLFRSGLRGPHPEWIIEGVILLLIVIPSLFKTVSSTNSYNIITRKRFSITLWLLFFTVIMVLAPGEYPVGNLYFAPATIIVSHRLDISRHSFWKEILLVVIIIAIGSIHFLL